MNNKKKKCIFKLYNFIMYICNVRIYNNYNNNKIISVQNNK